MPVKISHNISDAPPLPVSKRMMRVSLVVNDLTTDLPPVVEITFQTGIRPLRERSIVFQAGFDRLLASGRGSEYPS